MSLSLVDFDTSIDPEVSGLVPLNVGQAPMKLVNEEVAVREAESIEGLDYVFFRRFDDGRSSQVAAYIIDNSNEKYNETELSKIHETVWLNGSAPLLYIAWPTRVDILSCARGADFLSERDSTYRYKPVAKVFDEKQILSETIKTSAEIAERLQNRHRFSSLRLTDGTFWDDTQNAGLADADKGAHRCLIQAVIEADDALNGKENPVLRRLLLLTILIKYLEDRGVFEEETNWFGQFHEGANNFFDVLQGATPLQLKNLLYQLESKFNGDVFCLPAEGSDSLTSEDLRRVIATFVEAKTLKQQRHLWEPYSFRHLPVEVLSHLYQHFAQHGKGAIYTPPFVASLLLDFALPYDSITGEEKILDPTCGSGVFLVGAFRRLINHWRSSHQWQQPNVPTLKAILSRSIFGVEIQEESLHLAAFSLVLAVCDALKPNVIWNDLQFDKLVGANLIAGDFFDFVENQQTLINLFADQNHVFDVIIGNPPFLSTLTNSGTRVDKVAMRKRGALPDKQVAYLVTEQALELLATDGRMCLIQPSGIIYNENPRPFQSYLLTNNRWDYVLDFTSIRGLFPQGRNTTSLSTNNVDEDGDDDEEEGAHTSDTKVVVLVITKSVPSEGHIIRHLTFRRTFSVKEQIGFELDHYDYHNVSQEQVLNVPQTWKINLLGGGRLHHMTARLKGMGTLIEFVKSKHWEYGEGFIAAKRGKRVEAKWLTGKPLLPSVALKEGGIDRGLIKDKYVEATLFRSPYTKKRYSSPLVVIRMNEKLQCDFWDNGFLAFKAKVVGIHAPRSKATELNNFFEDFQKARPLLQAYCLIESTQLLVGRATAPAKRDIDNLVWPRKNESWDLVSWEKTLCNDLTEYMADYIRLGQNSSVLKKAADKNSLSRYAELYREMLGSIYENLRIGRYVHINGLICQSFHFGEHANLDWPEDWAEPLHNLIYGRWGNTIRTTRIVRLYQSNVIFIVKPDRLRYWIPSTAIRDADETLVNLIEQGY